MSLALLAALWASFMAIIALIVSAAQRREARATHRLVKMHCQDTDSFPPLGHVSLGDGATNTPRSLRIQLEADAAQAQAGINRARADANYLDEQRKREAGRRNH